MEMHSVINDVDDTEKNSDENRESVEKAKDKLKEEIRQLKSMILQLEWSLDQLKFKKTAVAFGPNSSDISIGTDTTEVPDITEELEFQLYRYAGLYCVEFSEEKFTFNISSLNKYEKNNTFSMQILNKQNKGALGKWVMPMSIDLDDLISKFPINELKYIPRFVRTCKHCVDCHFLRHEQFHALMDIVSPMKNCTLETNLSYTLISLNLMGVHNTEDDLYINLVIYLIYDINEARPHQIEVDSQTENKLDKKKMKYLKTSLMCFNKFDLCTAFEKMLTKKPFTWTKENDEDSPLEMNNLSSSDEEGFLEKFVLQPRKSPVLQKRRRKTRSSRIRRQRTVSNISESIRSNEQSISFQNTQETVKNLTEHSINQKDINTIKSTSYIHKPEQKQKKQAKLKFQLVGESNSCTDSNTVVSRMMTPKKKVTNKKLDKPFTSTPMRQNRSKLATLNSIDDISDITVNENSSRNMNAKSNIDSIKQNKLVDEDQHQNNELAKMPEIKMKMKKSSSIKSKSKNRKKNMSRRKSKKT